MEDSNKRGGGVSKQTQKPLEYGRKVKEIIISFGDYAKKKMSNKVARRSKNPEKITQNLFLIRKTIRENNPGRRLESSPYDKGFLRSQTF